MIIFYSIIQTAAEWTAFGVFWTNGQICSATSRLIIHVSMIARCYITFCQFLLSCIAWMTVHP